MGAKTTAGNLLELAEKELTLDKAITRLKEIKRSLQKLGGVLRGLDEKRLKGNTDYWLLLLKGWGGHVQRLSAELPMLEAIIQRRLMEVKE